LQFWEAKPPRVYPKLNKTALSQDNPNPKISVPGDGLGLKHITYIKKVLEFLNQTRNSIPEFTDVNRSGSEKGFNPIKRLFKQSAIYSISTSVQRLQGLILTPIYTSTLYLPQTSQYSNYGLIYTFIAFMNFVYLFGMDAAFLRYFFLGEKDRKTVFTSVFSVIFVCGIFTSLIIAVFAEPLSGFLLFSPNLAKFVRLAALILFFDSIGNFPFLILRAEERALSFTVFRVLRFSIELALNIVFVVFLKTGVLGILYANIIASVINGVVMFPIAWKYINFKIDIPLIKEMLYFGLPFLPNGIAFMTIEMVDRFLVTKFLGKEVLAFYHANYKFATVLLLLIVGFRNAWQPYFLKISRENASRGNYTKILNYYLFLAGALTVFMTLFIQDILTIRYFDAFFLLGKEYWTGIRFIPWIVLSYFFFGIYVIFTPAFYITKKSQYMALFTGSGALINICVNFVLLPMIGIWGAVIATLSAYGVMTISIIIVAQRLYPIPIKKKQLFSVLLMVGLTYLFYYIFPLGWMVKILILILFLAGCFLLLIKKDINLAPETLLSVGAPGADRKIKD
jgi:O-antigen/teichoic acid export membrane protein